MNSWLTRFAPSRLLSALAWTAVWVALNLAPFAALEGLSEDLWWWRADESFGLIDLSGLFAVIPFILVFELYLIATVFGLLKGRLLDARAGTWLYAIGVAGAIATVGFFAMCVILSWSLHGRAGTFLGLESVRLFAFALDPANVASITAPADLLLFAGGLGVALVCAATLFVLTPSFRTLKSAVMPAAVAVWMFAVVFYLFDDLIDETPPASLSRLQVSALHAISPRMSLVWGPLFLGRAEQFEVVPLDLDPYRSVDEYAAGVERVPEPRNVLLIVVEALRSDTLAAQGGDPRILPTVNRLAAQGHSFSNARAQSSETDASWVAILTGLYPLRFPYRDLRRDGDYPYTRIYDLLSAVGYRTALVTHEWDITRRVTAGGRLDLHFDPLTKSPESLAKSFPEITGGQPLAIDDIHTSDRINIERLERWIRRDPAKPFFAALYLGSTHFPYPQERLAERPFEPHGLDQEPSFLDYPAELADVMRNRYWNTLRSADSMIAQLLDTLAEQGSLDRTWVVVTGDHGQSFHEHGVVTHGRYLHEEAIRVPLVVWPDTGRNAVGSGTRPVAHIDIAPTLLDLLGLPPRGSFQGESLFGPDRPDGECRPVFSSVQLVTFEDAVVCWPWKFVRNHWGRGDRLFALDSDPHEQRDLSKRRLPNEGIDDGVGDRLSDMLDDFRNRQLSYYRLSSRQRLEAFPPRYDLPSRTAPAAPHGDR